MALSAHLANRRRPESGTTDVYCAFGGLLLLEDELASEPLAVEVDGFVFFLCEVFFAGSLSSTTTFFGGGVAAAACCRVRT